VAVGAASGLAGCPGSEGLTSPAATPVVLSPDGQQILDLSAFEIEELTRTVSPADIGEVTLTSYLAVHGQPKEHEQPLPVQFGVPESAAHALGILAMPNPDALGQNLNPLAEQPFREVLLGERGRQFLSQSGVVDTPEFEWTTEPSQLNTEEIELLGTATTVKSFHGIAADDDDSRTIMANLARVENEGSVVLVGDFLWRATPSEPLDERTECTDDFCQISSQDVSRVLGRFVGTGPHVSSCPQLADQLDADIGTLCFNEPPDIGPLPTIGITDARVVQQVEKTQVEGTGSPVRVYHQEKPNPPQLVEGENSAVVFEFDTLENLNRMQRPLRIAVFSGTSASNTQYQRAGTIEFSKTDLQDIKGGSEHTIAALHRLSTNGSGNGNPVFELDTGDVKISPVIQPLQVTSGVSTTLSVPSNRIRSLDTLRVGFVVFRDSPPTPSSIQGINTNVGNVPQDPGERYGQWNGSNASDNGMPRAPRRTFESATEYLQRAYPGDVATYLLDPSNPFAASGLSLLGLPDDMTRAMQFLNNEVMFNTSNPANIGTVRPDGQNRSNILSQIGRFGFHVVVGIVPSIAPNNSNATGYFDFHEQDASGQAYLPGMAVGLGGASPSGPDRGASTTAAQEVGHYFQDYLARNYLDPRSRHPMAQRRNSPNPFQAGPAPSGPNNVGRTLDKLHARHQDSENKGISGTDGPGVVSFAYDLDGGFTNLQRFSNPNGNFSVDGPGYNSNNPTSSIEGVESYMSYTGDDGQSWADERIHNRLINTASDGWSVPTMGGSNAKKFMVSATGTVTEDGGVQYERVTALRGIERYPDHEEHPVEVALLGPDEEVLVRANVRANLVITHSNGDLPAFPAFQLPFEQRGVRVRTTYDGTTTFMNPIDRSVRDAIGRVPENGFTGEPAPAREEINGVLDEVATLMEQGAYRDAATVMDGTVRTRIRNALGEYDSALGERTRSEMTALVDRMVERLEAAGEAG